MTLKGDNPRWLTFDCYGTLIQWDEGLTTAIQSILARHDRRDIGVDEAMRIYDDIEHALEQSKPFKSFLEVTRQSLTRTLREFDVACSEPDIAIMTSSISSMPPFPEVVGALAALKAGGFDTCIISNTDDGIIAGNVTQLGGHIDRVVTAQQAQAYKPDERLFRFAHDAIGLPQDEIVHVCASPQLDLTAAQSMGFRCIWIDRGTGRKPPAGYEPDATLATLDQVPALFREIGWM